MTYELPRVESTVEVEALLTWGNDKPWKKKKPRDGGGSGNHS